ncbi:MAG TPA: hypothetical protein PK076_02600 [Saprospiraceae bacterium]|nr:hypothetical protein [Saprospiraceae bacterium]HQW54983.1 hypothetical protein [Saprospiraceae bacterium]
MKLVQFIKQHSLAIAVVFFSLLSQSVFAQSSVRADRPAQSQQNQMTPEARAKKRTDAMKTQLTLTDDQYRKVYDLNLQQIKQQETMRANHDKNRKQVVDQYQKDLQNTLSADQYSKLQKNMEKRKEMRKDRKGQQNGNVKPGSPVR